MGQEQEHQADRDDPDEQPRGGGGPAQVKQEQDQLVDNRCDGYNKYNEQTNKQSWPFGVLR